MPIKKIPLFFIIPLIVLTNLALSQDDLAIYCKQRKYQTGKCIDCHGQSYGAC